MSDGVDPAQTPMQRDRLGLDWVIAVNMDPLEKARHSIHYIRIRGGGVFPGSFHFIMHATLIPLMFQFI